MSACGGWDKKIWSRSTVFNSSYLLMCDSILENRLTHPYPSREGIIFIEPGAATGAAGMNLFLAHLFFHGSVHLFRSGL